MVTKFHFSSGILPNSDKCFDRNIFLNKWNSTTYKQYRFYYSEFWYKKSVLLLVRQGRITKMLMIEVKTANYLRINEHFLFYFQIILFFLYAIIAENVINFK